ncbi:MAG: phenylalanine--tRNA ligase subunit beta [Halolamina sp.]
MPVVDVDTDELRALTGHDDKSDDEFKTDLFELGLEFEGETDDGELQFEFAPDRLDRLSVEGVARSLRYHYGDDHGVYVPDANAPEWTIEVEESVPEERPYVTGAVVRGLDLNEAALESLIQLQEKLHATMGRNRAKGAIGIHDLTMLKGEPLSQAEGSGVDLADPDSFDADDPESLGVAGRDVGGGPDLGDEPDRLDNPRSITYRGVAPDGDRFVPLDADGELSPAEVLTDHPTGETYADLVDGLERYPAIYDEIGLFSFPPVINGRRTEVTTDTREVFVELTGTDQWTIDRMCTIICYALSARGGQVEEVVVHYGADDGDGEGDAGDTDAADAEANIDADDKGRAGEPGDRLLRPVLDTETKTVAHDRIEAMLGVDLAPREVADLFERAGLEASLADDGQSGDADADTGQHQRTPGNTVAAGGDPDEATRAAAGTGTGAGEGGLPDPDEEAVSYEVEIPPYRVDVLHPLDLVDDVGRAYGFNELQPRYPEVGTVGGRHERSRSERAVRTSLVGLGFEDTLNFHMTAPDRNYERFRVAQGDDHFGADEPVRITAPYSEAYTQLRTWLLPSLLQVLENNTHRQYPQDLAEVGFVADRAAADDPDDPEGTGVAERTHVAGVLARTDATYEDAKARLQALARAFDAELRTPGIDHPSFIDGRAAAVELDGDRVGVLGELHPAVLVAHDMELPVAGFEFRLDGLTDY